MTIGEESLIGDTPAHSSRVWRSIDRLEALTGRHNRKPSAEHLALLESRDSDTALLTRNGCATEFPARHPGNAAANAGISQNLSVVRISFTTAEQRRVTAISTIVVLDVGNVCEVELIETASPSVPREERVSRAAWQPANVAETKPNGETCSGVTEAEEGDVGRGPDRIISRVIVYRSRPPAPVIVVEKPATVMVWRPAPRLVRHPGPTVVRFPDPTAVAIRRPIGRLIRLPNVAVTGNVNPLAVAVKALRAGVVPVGVMPALRVFNRAVTLGIPLIPCVFRRGGGDPVLRIVGAFDGD